jgi:signal peptidase I
MKRSKRKLVGTIAFYSLVVILGFYIIFGFVVTNKQMVNTLYIKGFRVGTKSMEPFLKVNDVVFAKKASEKDLKEGDIITFETYIKEGSFFGKVVVTHYIGKIEEVDGVNIYKTQSYSDYKSETYDEHWLDKNGNKTEITYDNIIGKYAFKIPWVGAIIYFIQSVFKNPILLALIIVNIIIIYVIIRLLIPKKDEEKISEERLEETEKDLQEETNDKTGK